MQLSPGLQIKGYTLQTHLGTGASGEVWRVCAHDEVYAIKFMNENLLDSAEAEKHLNRLKYEIHSLIQLRHAYVPRLYGYNLDFERPYMVMQYIEGASLSQLINSGEIFSIPLRQRFKMLCLLAVTLSAAHKKHIIHRDVKPANIRGTDPPYLLDFGIAWDARIDPHGHSVGTPTYMPPWGDPLDETGDNYSFTLVVYETLFGRHPLFTSQNIGKTTLETRQKAAEYLQCRSWLPGQLALNQIPPDLRGADFAHLDRVFEKALGPREGRYPALSAFLEDLRLGLLAGRADFPTMPPSSHYSAFLKAIDPHPGHEIDTHLPDELPTGRKYLLLSIAASIVIALAVIIAAAAS